MATYDKRPFFPDAAFLTDLSSLILHRSGISLGMIKNTTAHNMKKNMKLFIQFVPGLCK